MPENSYYPDFGGGSAPPEAGPSPPEAESPSAPDTEDQETESEEVGETALLPKSILAGMEFKPGEKLVLEMVHEYDDEIEVRPVSTETTKSEATSADEEIDAMASVKGE